MDCASPAKKIIVVPREVFTALSTETKLNALLLERLGRLQIVDQPSKAEAV